MAAFQVFRDGLAVSPVLTYDQCVMWINENTPYDLTEAVARQGYDIRRVSQ
jgi:hypothetical protein